MASVRVMAVFQGDSTLPEDRFVNTFHFHDLTTGYSTVAGDLRQAVIDFYENITVGGNALYQHMSAYVEREWNAVSYDLTAATPRVPTATPSTMGAAVGSGLPEEMAVCLTLEGAPPVTPRRRGRLYFGPLANNSSTLEGGTTDDPSHPANTSAGMVVSNLAASAQQLKAASALVGCPWSIRSSVPSENFVEIVGGWIDNAWDVQRRRGPKPTARDLWD